MLTALKWGRSCQTVRAYELCLCQAFYVIPKKTGVYFCICCFADRFKLCLSTLFFLFSFQYEVTTKAKFFFVPKRDWQLSVFAFFVTFYSEYYWSVIKKKKEKKCFSFTITIRPIHTAAPPAVPASMLMLFALSVVWPRP